MKHILNSLTEEEKNSIREQHGVGMKVTNENFHKMVNKKLGHVNLYEQTSVPTVKEIKDLIEQFGFNDVKIGKDKNGNDYIERGNHELGPIIFSHHAPSEGKPYCLMIEEMKQFDFSEKVCASNIIQFEKDLNKAMIKLKLAVERSKRQY